LPEKKKHGRKIQKREYLYEREIVFRTTSAQCKELEEGERGY